MESKTNYTVVGLFVLVLGSGLILASLWLSVGFHNKSYVEYEIYMKEAVSGLSDQSIVKFNGVGVGYVQEISLSHDDPQQVRILIEIEKGTPITISTTASLKSQGITGLTYIGLTAGTKFNHPLIKKPGQKYPVIPSRPSLLLQLDTAAKEISENFRKIADRIQDILDKENALALKKSLKNLEEITNMFATQTAVIKQAIGHANVFFGNAATASKAFPDAIHNLSNMGKQLGAAGIDISQTMRQGRMAIKTIENQAVPPAVGMLEKLEQVADNIDDLSKDLRRNPSMILRGKTPTKLGPGER